MKRGFTKPINEEHITRRKKTRKQVIKKAKMKAKMKAKKTKIEKPMLYLPNFFITPKTEFKENLPQAYVTTRRTRHNPKSIHARPTKLQKKPKTHVNGVVPFQLKKDTNKGQSLFKTLRRTLRSYQSPLKNVRVSLTKKH